MIVPLFLGNYWSTPTGAFDQLSTTLYLIDLVDYISGVGAPADQQPYLTQYGITSASIQNAVNVAWPDGQLSDASIQSEIWSLKSSGQLPASPTAIVMVFPGEGITPGAGTNVGYHQGFPIYFVPAIYAVAFKGGNVSQSLLSSHEIQEAATDPAWNFIQMGWGVDPSHEICDDATCGVPSGQYKSFTSNGITIIGCADNTQGGQCTSTGYIP
jgi:hypothetical protein